jgi:hypothetical protein
MDMSVARVHDSEKMVETGKTGVGSLSMARKISACVQLDCERAGEALLATRLRNLLPGDEDMSESSSVGVRGGVGGSVMVWLTEVRRTKETEIVASAAISLARLADLGVVLNTTKYGILQERGYVRGFGRVIYF